MVKKTTKTPQNKTTRGKANSTESEKRTNAVYIMLLQGYQRKSIIQYCSENFRVGERQVDKYIKKARIIMSKDQEVEIEHKKTEILSQLYHLYNKNMKIEDFRECRAVLKEVSEILGVRAPQKIDHTTGGDKIINEIDYEKLSTAALEEIELLRKEQQDESNTR